MDYDGVVNTLMWNEKGTKVSYNFPKDNKVNNFQAVQWISQFCFKCKFDIVVTSTWREERNYKDCLINGGLRKGIEILGCTQLTDKTRGEEIRDYLNAHPEIKQYIIVDDEDDFLPEQREHFVKVNADYGFHQPEYKQCIQLYIKTKNKIRRPIMFHKFSDIAYARPDFKRAEEEIYAFIENFNRAENYAQARKLYLEHEKAEEELDTAYTVASIRNTVDTTDAFYEGEMNYFYEQIPRLQLVGKKANEAMLASPFKADFEREFGGGFIKKMEAAIRLADESIVGEQVEESKLSQEYSKTVAGCTTNFRGEECNFYGLLKHMQSTDRAERKQAFNAWADLYRSVSDKLDGIYLRLCELRRTMAAKLGFSDYVEMAYLANGHYDYGAEEVAAFRVQIVKEVVPAVTKLYEEQRQRLGVEKLRYYDEQLIFPEGNATPIGDMRYLVDSAHQMYRQLSAQTGEFFDFMTEHELFDLETRKGKQMGGYCTFLNTYRAPFIFSNFNGTSADVDVLTHEAGHAFQAYTSARCLPLSSQIWSTSDICEIHSMTMEHFAYPWMDKFFGDKADRYRYAHLSEALKVVPYLCLVDHFQHEVFAHHYDAKGLRACWRRLEKIYMPWRDYDGNEFLEEGGFWMQKQHIFLYPFYYVDYALAQMGAFEYFTRSKQDKKAAWHDYYELCKAGGSKSYFELLKTGNLSNPFEDGSVRKVVSGVLKELEGQS